MKLSEEILSGLRERLDRDLISESEIASNIYFVNTKKERVREVAKYLTGEIKGRLAHISVIDRGLDGYEVIYHYSLDHLEKYLHINVKVSVPADEPEVESVSGEAPESSWSEREMMELTPVKFINHPDPRHLWLPYEWPNPVEGEEPESKKNRYQTSISVECKPNQPSLMPLGPYHPLLIEGAYFRVKLQDEEITDVDVKLGWNHRGIMKLFESRSYSRGVYLAERICGICNVTHTTAYLNAVETLSGINVPDRAKYIRTLMAELERVHSHLLWLGIAGDLIGFKTLFMLSWKIREKVMDVFEATTGSRRTPAMNVIGGVRKDLSDETIGKIERRLINIREDVERLIKLGYDHPLMRNRMQNIGILSFSNAVSGGAVGPTARASGWRLDTRWSTPYLAYAEGYTTWDVVTEDGGDVWARTMVRLKEILVSIDIAKQCLQSLKRVGGKIKTEIVDPKDFPYNEALGKAEAPRGELMYYIVSDGTSIPYSVRIRTPSFRNNSLLPNMLKGYTLADAPIIIGSIDPCYSCTDRIIVIRDSESPKAQEEATERFRLWI
ncbi:MAG: NADH-quinone oxidoreductase subunit C [Candidatus Bathyarchaeia archaeon]